MFGRGVLGGDFGTALEVVFGGVLGWVLAVDFGRVLGWVCVALPHRKKRRGGAGVRDYFFGLACDCLLTLSAVFGSGYAVIVAYNHDLSQ